jgi:mono/diheme cytochrome c family protein
VVLLLTSIVLGFAPASLAQGGEQYFQKECALCHGKDGASKTAAGTRMVIPDLRSHAVQQLSDEQMFETIAYGTGHKQYPHAFVKRGVQATTVHELVAYIRELAKAKK